MGVVGGRVGQAALDDARAVDPDGPVDDSAGADDQGAADPDPRVVDRVGGGAVENFPGSSQEVTNIHGYSLPSGMVSSYLTRNRASRGRPSAMNRVRAAGRVSRAASP